MPSPTLHIFSINREGVFRVWSERTNEWISDSFPLLCLMWSNLPEVFKDRLRKCTSTLINGLKEICLEQSPGIILNELSNLSWVPAPIFHIFKKIADDSALDPNVIVGFSIIGTTFPSGSSIDFPVLQLLSATLPELGSFPRLLPLISSELTDFPFRVCPLEICKSGNLASIKKYLRESLNFLRGADLSDEHLRALFVQLTRISNWLATSGLIEGSFEYFVVAFEFLLYIKCGDCRTVNLTSRFLVFDALQSAFSDISARPAKLPMDVFRENLTDLKHMSGLVSSTMLIQDSRVILRVFEELFLFRAVRELSSGKLTDLLRSLFPDRKSDVVKNWLLFWVVADPLMEKYT